MAATCDGLVGKIIKIGDHEQFVDVFMFVSRNYTEKLSCFSVMQQSIPAALICWQLRGFCPPCQSQGWGINNCARPWGRAYATIGATSKLLTCTWLPTENPNITRHG